MNIENLSTLKIHKLTQEQYDRELAAGRIDENALYLTPDEKTNVFPEYTYEDENKSLVITNGEPAWIVLNTVNYTEQSLTEEQKAQARANIGVPETEEIINMVRSSLVNAEEVAY